MKITNFTPNSEKEADESVSPSLSALEKKTASENNSSSSTAEDVRNQENSSSRLNFKNSVSGKGKLSLAKNVQRKSPVAILVSIIFGLVLGLGATSQTMSLVAVGHYLMEKFSTSQVFSHIRGSKIRSSKINSDDIAKCGKITRRCSFKHLSDKEIKSLKSHGIEVKSKKGLLGRHKIESINYNGKNFNATEFVKLSKNDSTLQGVFNKINNPKRKTLYTGKAWKTLQNLTGNVLDKINKLRKPKKGEKENTSFSKTLKNSSKSKESEVKSINTKAEKDGDVDGRGKKVGEQGKTFLKDLKTKFKGKLKDVFSKSTRNITSGAGAVVKFMCGVRSTSAMVVNAYKVMQVTAYIGYFSTIMKLIYALMSGTGASEAINDLGNRFIQPDKTTGKNLFDSDGYKYAAYGTVKNIDNRPEDLNQAMKTVGVGEDKVDRSIGDFKYDELSDGQKSIVDDDAKVPKKTSKNYTKYVIGSGVGAGFVASLTMGIKGFFDKTPAGLVANKTTCKAADSSLADIASFLSSPVAFIGGAIAGSIIGSIVGALLEPVLDSVMNGMKEGLTTGNENGEQIGNMITAGAGAQAAASSQSIGLRPQNIDEAVKTVSYMDKKNAELAAIDRANRSPFDITSKNTLMGNLMTNMLPFSTKVSSLSSGITSLLGMFNTSLRQASLTSFALAKDENDYRKQFEVCNDDDYKDVGVAADPFCNMQYGSNTETLDKEPTKVLDELVQKGDFIEAVGEDGKRVTGNDYMNKAVGYRVIGGEGDKKEILNGYNYRKYCMENTEPFYTNESMSGDDPRPEYCYKDSIDAETKNNTKGEELKKEINNYRMYLIDDATLDGMENDEDEEQPSEMNQEAGDDYPFRGPEYYNYGCSDDSLATGNCTEYGGLGIIRQCVSFAKWRASQQIAGNNTGKKEGQSGWAYNVGLTGNGIQFADKLIDNNVADRVSVDDLRTGDFVSTSQGGSAYGHIAVVTRVMGDKFEVEQYNAAWVRWNGLAKAIYSRSIHSKRDKNIVKIARIRRPAGAR